MILPKDMLVDLETGNRVKEMLAEKSSTSLPNDFDTNMFSQLQGTSAQRSMQNNLAQAIGSGFGSLNGGNPLSQSFINPFGR